MGITDVVVKVNPELTGLPDPWRLPTLRSIVERLEAEGLNVVGLEGDPFDMAPIKEYAETGLRDPAAQRETALEHYRELLESMGRLGIRLLCYNFMVGKGWSRTGVREGRGGAKATYFSLSQSKADDGGRQPPTAGLRLAHDQVWANYEYFIRAVMPTAEKCGVRMALHPDDPCLDSLGGYARIFGSVEAYDRAYAIYPSPSNAITFCQANFKLMFTNGNCHNCPQAANADSPHPPRPANPGNPAKALADAARHFWKRIAFIHIRDVEGDKTDFTELFHDQGDTDQFALMRAYLELGLDVPVRGDHVPEMAYDRTLTPEGTPGYFTLGRLFANGYLRALMQGCVSRSQV